MSKDDNIAKLKTKTNQLINDPSGNNVNEVRKVLKSMVEDAKTNPENKDEYIKICYSSKLSLDQAIDQKIADLLEETCPSLTMAKNTMSDEEYKKYYANKLEQLTNAFSLYNELQKLKVDADAVDKIIDIFNNYSFQDNHNKSLGGDINDFGDE